jgi:hypothetical protein
MRSAARRSLCAVLASCLGVLAVSLGAASCKKPPPASETLAPPPAELVPDASVRDGSVVADRDLWKAALESPDDAIELARLAESEGATGLLAGLEEGGAVGLTALAALPWAEDAEVATPRLAEILRSTTPAALGPVLDSLEGVVQRPRTQTEPLAPLGLHACFDALAAIARRSDAPAPLRARAVSVARLIAARGPYDPRILPTDFDHLAPQTGPVTRSRAPPSRSSQTSWRGSLGCFFGPFLPSLVASGGVFARPFSVRPPVSPWLRPVSRPPPRVFRHFPRPTGGFCAVFRAFLRVPAPRANPCHQ